jgi:hypothetical protein
VLPQLKASYQHALHPLTVALSANQPPRVLKAQRTRRRRIRSTFGSVDGSVLKVEMAVSSKGFTINKTRVYGRHGVTYLHI